MISRNLVGVLGAGLSLFSGTAFAYGYSSYGGGGSDSIERSHFLSVSGGIASPSFSSALTENPAGLVYNYQFKLLGTVGTQGSNFNPVGFGGNILTGNGTVGGAIGVQTYDGSSATPGQFGQLTYGLAAVVESIDLAIGLGGTYGLWNNGQVGVGGWNLNLGLIFNSRGPFRVGATAFQLVGGVSALGLGVAGDISQYATLALDATTTTQFTGTTVKPGLSIYLGDFQLTASYGVAVDPGLNSWLRRGSSLGIGFKLGRAAGLQAYYNEIAQYFVGVNFNL